LADCDDPGDLGRSERERERERERDREREREREWQGNRERGEEERGRGRGRERERERERELQGTDPGNLRGITDNPGISEASLIVTQISLIVRASLIQPTPRRGTRQPSLAAVITDI
jgi:hypothetical protein